MERVAQIGSLLKKIYRLYSLELVSYLKDQGFTDLRPSFLDVLMHLCEEEGLSIKEIGNACALKKQTMTSHLNDLEKRGYINRQPGLMDKREQRVFLTEYGHKFKLALQAGISLLEEQYASRVGGVELERAQLMLHNLHHKLTDAAYSTEAL